jgi:hypothetical protein
MGLRRSTPPRASSAGVHRPSCLLFLAFLTIITCKARAQSPPDAPPAYTLHVYTDLIELPTLVLGRNDHPVRSLNPKDINIRLDGGSPFHPSGIRLEGDDPILLAILIDTQGKPSPLLTAFQNGFPAWITSSFQPQDRISLYAMNCALFRTAYDQPPNAALLETALNSVIGSAQSDGKKGDVACQDQSGLRDYLDLIIKRSYPMPGRRVVLILSDGMDDKGLLVWTDLISDAALYSVTTFGINVPDAQLFPWGGSFNDLSQRSGGLNITTTPERVSHTLAQFIDFLRQRYILQFPMPAPIDNNVHQALVTIDRSTKLIRPSQITVPITHPSTQAGPVNVPVEDRPANPNQP